MQRVLHHTFFEKNHSYLTTIKGVSQYLKTIFYICIKNDIVTKCNIMQKNINYKLTDATFKCYNSKLRKYV